MWVGQISPLKWVKSSALLTLRLPEAKPDPDREYPMQILPIRPYEKEDDG